MYPGRRPHLLGPREGATLLCGGIDRPSEAAELPADLQQGNFVWPTVFADVANRMCIAQKRDLQTAADDPQVRRAPRPADKPARSLIEQLTWRVGASFVAFASLDDKRGSVGAR